MWNDIISIIGIACMSVLFVVAEPMILIKRQLGFKEEEIGKNPLRDFFTKLMYCGLCSGFWIAWAITLDFKTACIISVLAEIIHRKIS